MVAIPGHRPSIQLDHLVRQSLGQWPQRPPGLEPSAKQPGTWLRARPDLERKVTQPYLKLPGAQRLKTLPDGLYLHFSTQAAEPYVDILCIEACSTYQNLLDKRSRFAPSTSSLLAVCPVEWLLQPGIPGNNIPRWRLIRMVKKEPREPLILPVRDARVLFGLKPQQFRGFMASQTAQAHEFFCPMEALTDLDGPRNPALRALLARASAASNFMDMAEGPRALR
ncbi:MAG: hypothetical protein JWR10_3693 [Rubritepida sp.]|nr:hypothetical protein [Rubritepida sp.]